MNPGKQVHTATPPETWHWLLISHGEGLQGSSIVGAVTGTPWRFEIAKYTMNFTIFNCFSLLIQS